jgi:hypothetical protein
MMMLTDKQRVERIVKALKTIHKGYSKRKSADTDTVKVLELLIADFEMQLINLEMAEL